jgi:glycine cleavage system aminomethyltransferase T
VPAFDYAPDWSLDEGDWQHIPAVGGEPSSPLELGIEHTLHPDKDADFVGKEALLAEARAGGPPRRQADLELETRDVVEAFLQNGRAPILNCQTRVWGEPLRVFDADDGIGRASSIVWSPQRKTLIGLASIDGERATAGVEVRLEWPVGDGASGPVAATVAELPFVTLRRAA